MDKTLQEILELEDCDFLNCTEEEQSEILELLEDYKSKKLDRSTLIDIEIKLDHLYDVQWYDKYPISDGGDFRIDDDY